MYSQFYQLLNLSSAVRPTKVGEAGSPKLIPRSDKKNENGLTRARARGSLFRASVLKAVTKLEFKLFIVVHIYTYIYKNHLIQGLRKEFDTDEPWGCQLVLGTLKSPCTLANTSPFI